MMGLICQVTNIVKGHFKLFPRTARETQRQESVSLIPRVQPLPSRYIGSVSHPGVLLHRDAVTQGCCYTGVLLHRGVVAQRLQTAITVEHKVRTIGYPVRREEEE